MDPDQYIPMNDCINGFLYRIDARNAKLGVYSSDRKWFKISRFKFKTNFLDTEDHWDTGEPHGTAKPLEEIGPVPPMSSDDLLIYLNEKNKKYFGKENPMRKAR